MALSRQVKSAPEKAPTQDICSEIETLRDGSRVVVRPISRQDVELERRFIEGLSAEARRFRFLSSMKYASDDLLRQLTDLDPSSEVAYVALAESDPQQEVGVARYSAQADGAAELAVTVGDRWQGKGLATALLTRLIRVARDRGVSTLYSIDAEDNNAMRDLALHMGFTRTRDPDDSSQVVHSLRLKS